MSVAEFARNTSIEAVLFSYIANSIDFMLITEYNKVDFGNNLGNQPAPSETVDLGNQKLDLIFLKYRVDHNNAPIIRDDTVECQLRFGGNWRQVVVPFNAIIAISLADSDQYTIRLPVSLSSIEDEPKAIKNNGSAINTKKKSHLSVVK